MTETTFRANVREADEKVVLDLEGDINTFAEQTLERAYAEAEGLDPSAIALNFEGVDYINSTGIALIVSLLAEARKHQRELVVYGLSDHYQEIFKITRLADFMTIYEDEHAAFAA